MNFDPKVERQYGILLALRSGDWVPAQLLANKFAVSVRTVYRDIEDLLSHGVPIEGARGPEGGYRLRSELPIPAELFSSLESFSLQYQRNFPFLASTEEPQLDYLPRISDALQHRIFFDTTDWFWRGRPSDWLETLKDAVAQCNAVQFDYRERGLTESKKVLLMPYGLVWKAGEWYLVGPELNGPIRRFSLGRIDALVTTALTFTMPTNFNIGVVWADLIEEFGKGDHAVVILVSEEAKPQLQRLHLKSNSKVEETTDGSLQLTLFVDSWEWMIPLIASFGSAVKVLEPVQLRESLIDFLKDALRIYYDHEKSVSHAETTN